MKRNNNKERRFVSEYLKDQNGTQAAIRAGYSKRTANEQASQLLAKLSVKTAIDEKLKKVEEKALITAEEVIRELKRVGLVDVRQAFKEDGSLKDLKDIPEDVTRAIGGIDVDELFEGHGQDRTQVGFTKKVKFWDKVRALELLGKHLAMFTDKVDATLREPEKLEFVPAKSKRETDRGH